MLEGGNNSNPVVAVAGVRSSEPTHRWRDCLPTLDGDRVTLRELRAADAPWLVAMITPPEVSRFISPPPSTVPAFERFIARSRAQQSAGVLACFAVTLRGHDSPIGLFQLRALTPDFAVAEWGFAISSDFWGTGLFAECAALVLEFAFSKVGVHRLEARAAVLNGRGNRALQKLGAVQEGVLRQAFLFDGDYVDQMLYSLVEDEWRASRDVGPRVHSVVIH